MQKAIAPTGLAKYIPILGWLPHYQRGWLRFDLLAGLVAGKAWFPYFRLYSPKQEFLDKSWVLLDIEKA